MAKTQEIAAAQQTAVVGITDEELMEFAGAGVSTDMRDQITPFIRIIQTNSPEANKRDDKYIEGAEAGDMFFKDTLQLVKGEKGFEMCVFHRENALVEWVPRTEGGGGGGFVGQYPATHQILKTAKRNDKRVLILPNGNELRETVYFFGFLPEFENRLGILSMSRSNLRTAREWNSLMNALKFPNGAVMPAFVRTYRVTTTYEKNDSGDYFRFGARVEKAPSADLMRMAMTGARSARDGYYDMAATAAADYKDASDHAEGGTAPTIDESGKPLSDQHGDLPF
jgi:hypothetical protein